MHLLRVEANSDLWSDIRTETYSSKPPFDQTGQHTNGEAESREWRWVCLAKLHCTEMVFIAGDLAWTAWDMTHTAVQ